MTTETIPTERTEQKTKVVRVGGGGDAVYGIGLFGAWFFYLSHVATFQQGVLGFLKGLVWPAMLVYELLKFLNK